MAAITLRADKGSPLTNAEVDANFTNLNTGKLEKASNLSDLANTTTARSNLGLGNVNNTSDANKPISTATQTALNAKENTANKGAANGYAALDATGKVPAAQLPSYVDDVLEYANLAAFPVTGEAGKIYVALDTNKTYRWSGSAYIYITSGAVDSVAGKTGVVVLAKADVGLGSVDNTSDANKPISTATQLALDGKAPSTHVGATGTAHGVATTLVAGFMSAADKSKLDGVAANANNYSHPTGDGNLHVPATGTTNNGKVLKAGATAGSLSWGTLAKADVGLSSVDNTSDANKPISTATQTALNAKQNAATAVTKDSATGIAYIPAGTSAQRPASPVFGAQRANSTTGAMEWWNGTAWAPMGGGATGGIGNAAFYENDTTITVNYTITTGKNAMTAGPVTINNGVTVTVPNGSVWTVI